VKKICLEIIRPNSKASLDRNGNPFALKCIFSWQKRATNGSSFCVVEKTILKQKIVMYSENLLQD